MSKWVVNSRQGFPPGGWSYAQVEGIPHNFSCSGDVSTLANSVAMFRGANKLPRASYASALEDIFSYTAARLNYDPQWCVQTDLPLSQVSDAAKEPAPCSGCGAKVTT